MREFLDSFQEAGGIGAIALLTTPLSSAKAAASAGPERRSQ
jgi:hypothetical protein